ncbi:acyltransferase [Enterococcus faecium]|uniref:acyltransferase n=1 Tax=Enterococcus faecium TaxID=1352 RepID=UPI00338E4D72
MDKVLFKIALWACNSIFKGTRFFGIKRKIFNSIGIIVGENTKIVGPVNISRVAKLEIGKNNWIGANLTIHGNGSVFIGDNNDFAPEVTILTGSHEIGSHHRRAGEGISFQYRIGNGNWIGAKSTLINGCSLGDGVIIGASALVTKDCEDDFLYVGVPAKKTKKLRSS